MQAPRNRRTRLLSATAAPILVAALGVLAGPAAADDDDQPIAAEEMQRIRKTLEAKGYRDIHDIERDDGRYEVDATDAAGYPVDIELDPKTLDIRHLRRDD